MDIVVVALLILDDGRMTTAFYQMLPRVSHSHSCPSNTGRRTDDAAIPQVRVEEKSNLSDFAQTYLIFCP